MAQTNARKNNSLPLFDFRNKAKNADQNISYMLNRTNRMFAWNKLPESIPDFILENIIQTNGYAVFYKHNDTLYAFGRDAGLGGEPDPYYMPTLAVITNPALNLSVTAKIGEDCVVMYNSSNVYYEGTPNSLIPMMSKYSTWLAENELSINVAQIVTRIQYAIAAADDRTKKSAEKFIDGLIHGNLEVIADSKFLDEDLKTLPLSTSSSSALKDYMELEQYIKASFYNELGLNANYNMKREALNSSESSLNNDILAPLVDDMLHMRQYYAKKVNEMFGTDISVELASSWKDNDEEQDAILDNLKRGESVDDADEIATEAENNPEETTPEEEENNDTEHNEA